MRKLSVGRPTVPGMNAIEHAPEQDRRPHTLLERHLVVGAHTYQITASGTGDEQVHLHLSGWDADGAAVGEFSGGISPTDLPAVADALASTLAGLVALRAAPALPRRLQAGRVTGGGTGPGAAPRVAELPKRHPNQGTRWSAEDDDRLLARFHEGATERTLIEEFGRSRGGIRARLETLGVVEPGSTPLYRDRLPAPRTAAITEAERPPGTDAAGGPEVSLRGDHPDRGPAGLNPEE